jgi:PEP-CTERM motif-containing protein
MSKHNVNGRSCSPRALGVALLVLAVSLSTAVVNSARGASLVPIAMSSGYSSGDIIAEVGASPVTGTNTNQFGFVYYEEGSGGTTSGGLPTNAGQSRSFVSTYNPNTTFQFQPYDGGTPGSFSSNYLVNGGTVTLTTPAAYSQLAFLTEAVDGSSFTATLNFSNAASLITPGYSDPDWTGSGGNNALAVDVTGAGNSTTTTGPGVHLFEHDYTLPGTYEGALLTSITFSNTGGNPEFYFAVSGAAPVPEPASLVLSGLGAVGLLLAVRRRRRQV